jgi:hypothetical protein
MRLSDSVGGGCSRGRELREDLEANEKKVAKLL